MIEIKKYQKLILQSVVLLLLSFGTCLRASHVVGGEITYQCLGNNVYNISLRLFRDCQGQTLPGSVSIVVRTGTGGMVGTYNALSGSTSLLQINKPACATLSPNFCVETAEYTITSVNLGPSSTGYVFSTQLCCRNLNISNVASATAYGSTTTSSTLATSPCNNSPTFINNPPLVIAYNFPVTINASAVDQDGDSLYYEFCSPLKNTPPGPPFDTIPFSGNNYSKKPIPSNPAFSINPHTGIITGTVSAIGNYLVSICVSEYRNGAYIGKIQRDYQFNAIQAWALSATIPVDSAINPSCKGASDGRIALQLAGGVPPYTYQWSNGGQTNAIGGLGAGTYSVVITDALSCKDTVQVTLVNPDSLSMSVTSQIPASCPSVADGMANISIHGGTPPYTILWDNAISGNQGSQLSAGIHQVFVTDSSGCQSVFDLTIPVLNNFKIQVDSLKNVSCKGGSDGYIGVSATGAIGQVTFAWAHGPVSFEQKGLPIGSYSVTAIDSKGCRDTMVIEINEPDLLQGRVDSTKNSSCDNIADGKVYTSIWGGTPPYTLRCPAGDTSGHVFIKMPVGPHILTLQDANGCTVSLSSTIGKNAPLEFTALTVESPTCFDGEDGYAEPQVTGGEKPYVFHWSNGEVGNARHTLKAGWYEVSVVDKNRCTKDTTFYVRPLEEPLLEIAQTESTCMTKANAELQVSVSGPSKNYEFYVDSMPLGVINGKLFAGWHEVQAMDQDGCTLTEKYLIFSRMEEQIFVPNAFTPNGDGINDLFKIEGDKDCFENASLRIFNRWGNVVYSSEDPFGKSWNGFVENNRAPQATYLYRFQSDQYQKQGHITIFF